MAPRNATIANKLSVQHVRIAATEPVQTDLNAYLASKSQSMTGLIGSGVHGLENALLALFPTFVPSGRIRISEFHEALGVRGNYLTIKKLDVSLKRFNTIGWFGEEEP